ncbi:acrosin-like [Cyrtonyx montezumae]|uniref:acrosin-like n=1 Tax=Cyrtonyx montezumae TaxID=9017 RepID=UPI0032DA32C1
MRCLSPTGVMVLLLLLILVPLAACQPVHHTSGVCDTCGLRPLAYQYGNMRVVGGTDALHGSWPWIVSIQNPLFSGTGHMCGGSLITPQWVLSAAHCFGHPSYVLESRVVIGANDLTQLGHGVEVRTIRRAILHEHYNNKTMANDIALLELDLPVWCSDYIQLACVPDASLHVDELTECYISGWGVTQARSAQPAQTAEILQEARVQLIDIQRCNSSRWYGGAVHPHNLCAGYPQGGIDTCQGDSGGPLVCRDNNADYFWLIGVTSWGKGCARAFRPGIYTSTQQYYDWILRQMRAAAHLTSRTETHVTTASSHYNATEPVPTPTQPTVSSSCPHLLQKLKDFFTRVQELLQTTLGKKA